MAGTRRTILWHSSEDQIVRTRILWLILLSVTVTALPVSARQAPKPEKPAKAVPAIPAKDSKQEFPKKTRISAAIDLWDGGSARILTGEISLVSIPVLLGGHTDCHLAPTESWPHATVSALSFRQPAQYQWLTCLYAHAPPLMG